MNQTHQAQAKIESFKLQLWGAMQLNQKEKMAATNAYLACREIGVNKVRNDPDFNKNRGFQAGVMEFEFSQAVFASL